MKRKNRFFVPFVLFAFLLSILSPFTVLAAKNSQPFAREAALEYMDARKTMLSTGDVTALSTIAIAGIVTDEANHRAYLTEHNASLPEVTYTIDAVETLDGGAIVHLREIGAKTRVGDTPIEISHILTITFRENGDPLVISDNYSEIHTGFESCSYVAPNASEQSRAFVLTSKNCFLHIANNEVGYLEKASDYNLDDKYANPGTADYSKYGAWLGASKMPWCAAFVSWCANQAHVLTSIIPKTDSVYAMRNFYINAGRYYESAARGGTYTPLPGDLVFIYWKEPYGHIGIIYSVEGNNITVIEGNWDAKVNKRTLVLTDTSLTGYASPGIFLTDHIWTGTAPDEYCSNCGANRQYSADW